MQDKFLKVIKLISHMNLDLPKNYNNYRTIQDKLSINMANKIIKIDDKTFYVYTPHKLSTNKIIIYIHGGGWVLGSNKYYSFTLKNLANELKRNIITFDYPLAPEHPFPEGFNYSYDSVKSLIKKHQEYNIDPKNIIIMGDSAGANLATAICIKAKKTKEFKIKKEILLYPLVQTNFLNNSKYSSIEENGYNYYLTKKMIQDYLKLYLPKKKDYNNPYVAPIAAKNLFNMPEAFIITADLDPLRDEGCAYAKKLKRYFNKVTYYNMKDVIHGFFNNPLYFKENYYIIKKIKRFVGDKNE